MKRLFFRRSLLSILGLISLSAWATETSYNVSLTPVPNPTTLSSSGGTAIYNRTITSTVSTPQTLQYHGLLTRPDGSQLPMTASLSMPLAAFEIKKQNNLGFSIPSYYPAGDYSYRLYFHATALDYSSYAFNFKKTGSNPAPTPRVTVTQPTSLPAIPYNGGSATIKSSINNFSNYSDTLRVWTILSKTNGDTRILRAPQTITVNAKAEYRFSDVSFSLVDADLMGSYTVTTYAMSTLRNTPAVVAASTVEKTGIPVTTIHLPDPALQQCLTEQIESQQWQFVQDVREFNCIDRGVKDITGLPALFALQTLNLAENDIKQVDEWQLPTTLNALDLSNNRIGELLLTRSLSSLTSLRVAGNRLRNMPNIEMATNLTNIDLSYNPIPGFQVNEFASRASNLVSFAAAGIVFENQAIIDTLSNHLYLQEINLSDTGLLIQNLPFNFNLRSLRLANTHILDSYVLNRFSQLRVLDIANTNLLDLNGVLHFADLEELNVGGNNMRQHYQLAQLIQNNPRLRKLSIANIDLPPHWFDSLFTWPVGNSALEDLDISYTNQRTLTLPFSNLRHLNISGNPITGTLYLINSASLLTLKAGYTRLVDIHSPSILSQLNVLDLSGNSGMNQENIAMFIRNAQQLRELHLQDLTLMRPWGEYELYFAAQTLRTLNIQNMIGDIQLPFMPNLKVLNVNAYQATSNIPLNVGAMPRLRSLRIDHWRHPTWFLDQFIDLDELSIAYMKEAPSDYVSNLVARHPNLRYLSLAGLNLRNASISYLLNSSRETLRTLNLSDTQLTRQALDQLGWLPILREFNFSRNQLDFFYAGMMPFAQSIDLSYTGLHYFDPYRPNNALPLRALNLSGNPLQNFSLVNLLSSHQSLNELALDHVDLSPVEWTSISSLMRHIKSLSIAYSQSVINPLDLPALASLDVSGNAVQLNGFSPYIRQLKMNDASLTAPLYLTRDDIGFRVLEIANLEIDPFHLRGLLMNSAVLQSLNIEGISFEGESLNALLNDWVGDRLTSPLRSLNINNTQMQIDPMLQLSNLRSLAVSGLGLEVIPYTGSVLTELNISNNPLQDLAIPMMRNLTSLNLSGVPTEQLFRLPELMASAPNLTELALANNGLSNLNGLDLHSLRRLDLHGNQLMSADGVPQTPNLHHLDLSGNQLQQVWAIGPMQEGLRSINLSDNANLDCVEVQRLRSMSTVLSVESPAHCSAP